MPATMTVRQQQVARMLVAEISDIIRREMNDPRLGFATLVGAEPSRDLRHARVYVSILGDEEDQRRSLEALNGAVGYIRSLLGPRLTMRYVPEITFRLDHTAESAQHIEVLLRGLAHAEAEPLENARADDASTDR